VTAESAASLTMARRDITAGLLEREPSRTHFLKTASEETIPGRYDLGSRCKGWTLWPTPYTYIETAFFADLDVLKINDEFILKLDVLRLQRIRIFEAPCVTTEYGRSVVVTCRDMITIFQRALANDEVRHSKRGRVVSVRVQGPLESPTA
jgi:hypothetical protein